MSPSPQDMFDQVAELTELYLLDEISDDQLAELEALVRGDNAAAQVMRTVLKQAGTMRVVFSEQRTFASHIGEIDRDEYLALLQTLQPTEEPELVHLVGRLEMKRPLWQQWPVVIPSGIAAVLLIAVTLIVTLSGSQTSTPLANNTSPKPAESVPPILRDQTVATLTATHDAQWAERASARGSSLRIGSELEPGDRLTLTAGYAEITTARGAVAILEAPATIELTNNNNALRLESGKLVGICEARLSKGFAVLTEHARIIDLGTRFGVEITQGTTRTTVFEGEVAVAAAAPESSEAKPVYLTQGQSAQVDRLARVERLTTAPQSRFVRQWQAVAQPPQVTGQIEYRPALPASLAVGDSESDEIQLYPEAMSVQLENDFRATLTEPGKHETFAVEDAQPIDATRVDTYLVHYDLKIGGVEASKPRNATIRFDRPILGVIADEKLLFASDRLFAPVGMDFGLSVNPEDPDRPTGRGLEPKLSLPGDIVEISEDRMTLTVELYGAMALDQLRILVQSPEPTVQ